MKKNAKKALIASIMSIVICCTMLMGTTMAWFTDSVTSSVNTIKAGNLKIGVYAGSEEITGEDTDPKLFDVELWEPGVYVYENITVKNEGNLALKYKMSVNVGDAVKVNGKTLEEVLKFAVVDEIADGTTRDGVKALINASNTYNSLNSAIEGETSLYPVGNTNQYPTEATVAIVIFWEPGDNDNDFNLSNNKKGDNGETALKIELGINVEATQLPYEEDSFNDQYDKDATYADDTTTPPAPPAPPAPGHTCVPSTDWVSDGDNHVKYACTDANCTAGSYEFVTESEAHKTADNDHDCDVCGKENISLCADTNPLDGKCDVCGADVGHTCVDVDTDTDHLCDTCGEPFGEHKYVNGECNCSAVFYDFNDTTTINGWRHHWDNDGVWALRNDNGVLVHSRNGVNSLFATGVAINNTLYAGVKYTIKADIGYTDPEALDSLKFTFALTPGGFDKKPEYLSKIVSAEKGKMTGFEFTFTPLEDISDAWIIFNCDDKDNHFNGSNVYDPEKPNDYVNREYNPTDLRIDNVSIIPAN